MKVYDHIDDEEPEVDPNGFIALFLGAGVIGAIIQIINYIIKIY